MTSGFRLLKPLHSRRMLLRTLSSTAARGALLGSRLTALDALCISDHVSPEWAHGCLMD